MRLVKVNPIVVASVCCLNVLVHPSSFLFSFVPLCTSLQLESSQHIRGKARMRLLVVLSDGESVNLDVAEDMSLPDFQALLEAEVC